jgi:hypothetical protein
MGSPVRRKARKSDSTVSGRRMLRASIRGWVELRSRKRRSETGRREKEDRGSIVREDRKVEKEGGEERDLDVRLLLDVPIPFAQVALWVEESNLRSKSTTEHTSNSQLLLPPPSQGQSAS